MSWPGFLRKLVGAEPNQLDNLMRAIRGFIGIWLAVLAALAVVTAGLMIIKYGVLAHPLSFLETEIWLTA
jgi:hypothetical protein